MRKQIRILSLCAFFVIAGVAQAQQIDGFFGGGTITAPSAASASGKYSAQSLRGGTYLNAGGDFVFKNHVGFNAEVAWRAKQNLYQGFQPFRPIFYDFNALYAPRVARLQPELMAGFGGESIRFYQPFVTCSAFSCSNFVSSNHLMGHIAGGLRFYLTPSIFVRGEAHAYFIRNNFEFSSPRAERFGVSLGYTFSPHD